jgi:chemotaxis protein CheD
MQKSLAQPNRKAPSEIIVRTNECRLAKLGERLVARNILADVVLTIQVPAGGFAAMLRFSAPVERTVSRARLETLWNFADQAIELVFQSIRSMDVLTDDIVVSAIGGADVTGQTFGRGKQLAIAVQKSLWRHGVMLKGNDLGGEQSRLVWLESASGRLIVRSKVPERSNTREIRCPEESLQHLAS